MTLQERLEELMKEKGWDHADLMRVSGQSSSVVSQWLGNGSKAIKTIGKIEAAMRIAEETGYSATWIAKGIPPKRLPAVQMAVGTGKTAAAIKVMEHLRGAEPPSPPSEFADRHEVSDSDWALLQDIKDAMAHSRLAKQVEGIRTEVAELREFANNVMAKRAQGEGAPPKTEQFVNKQQRAARKARA